MRKCHLIKHGKAIILHVKQWESEMIILQDHNTNTMFSMIYYKMVTVKSVRKNVSGLNRSLTHTTS